MDARYITPFMTSIQTVLGTMLQLAVEVGEPRVKSGDDPAHDISGVIGVSGEVAGAVVLSMNLGTAASVVALFTGEAADPESEEFADAVGELVNMISGTAKSGFPRGGVSMSCPSVIVGAGHRVASVPGVASVVIPCDTDCGRIVLGVALRGARELAASGAA